MDEHVSEPHLTETPDASDSPLPYMVGIGASAGGLKALEELFQAIPADAGLSFVIVQHLSPTFKSMMDELIARVTTIPIQIITQGLVPQPNTIYLMPSGSELILTNGALELITRDPAATVPLPIDRFFTSLGQALGNHAIGIVLSGTGSDGSRGIVDIHEAGGLVIVQEPKSAQFDSMPLSALETGLVDLVLTPAHMARTLVTYLSNPYSGRQYSVQGEAWTEPIETVFRLLWDQHGIDFTHYKTAMIMRRIERRVSLSEFGTIEAYAQHLAEDGFALDQLYKDLLIGVTRFFRDTDAFTYLDRDILALLMQDARRTQELRIWVAGCATGEEAYSLAMLLHESLRQQSAPISIQLFATDVHQASLDIASEGLYPYEAIERISPERLARYFIEEADGFRVVPAIRQMVVFARHDLTRDAPFTKLDLITCRNVLIYFQTELQQQILRRLHYGLRLGGMLFLGHSESVGGLAEVFTEVDRHWKVYRKDHPSGLLSEAMTPSLSTPHALPTKFVGRTQPLPPRSPAARQQLYNVLLEAVAPAGILVNAQGKWEHIIGDVTPFFQSLRGPNDTHVLELIHPDLVGTLQVAMLRATSELQVITYHHVSFVTGLETERATLRVIPLIEARDRPPSLFVTFMLDAEEQTQDRAASPTQSYIDDDRMHLIEQELYQTKAALHTTVGELQARTEELQTTNEELVASNEELQSSNEELQSVNEELHTVNAEYQLKNQQLATLNTDTENLLRSTDIGTVFLDTQQCIRKYTPAVIAVIPLQPQDIGRPLSHFTTLLDISQEVLQDLIQQVMKNHTPITREVEVSTGTWLLMRIHPFIAPGDDVEGTVVTFVDVTERKQAEQDRQAYEARLRREAALRQLLESTSDAMVVVDENGRVVHANVQAETVFGYDRHELLEYPVETLMPQRFRQGHKVHRQDLFRAASSRAMGVDLDLYGQHRDGREFPVEVNLIPIEAEDGVLVAAAIRDVTERKRAELLQRQMGELERKNHELQTQQAALDAAVAALERSNADLDAFISIASHDLKEPLRGIRNYAQMLQEDCADLLSPSHQDDLETLGRLVKRLEQRIEDLRTYARIGRINVDPELLDMEKVVAEVCEQLSVLLTEQGVNLRLPHPLPTVRYHRAHLVTVLQNLIANAARYNDKSGRWIEIGCQEQTHSHVFYVKDNGIGIAPHLQDEAFLMFRRLHSEEFAGSGSGAGLAIVRRILEGDGGRIWLDSQLGQGTTVYFTLGTVIKGNR